MDPRAHRRFLDYVDKHVYFGGPDLPKLGREQWLELDAERAAFEARDPDSLDDDERRRFRALRRLLLVD
ncbi:MAG: hypothetical protein VYE22_08850 [Myxococcota bacterium]|nr:hypothetical protein [Myxococcota bacterium]